MALHKYLREAWKKPKDNPFYKERLIEWRKENTTTRIERPTRLDRARSLGYKPIQGLLLVRQRVGRGRRQRPHDMKGRRPKAYRKAKVLQMNYQEIAEQRANEKYKNCEVLNSYWVGEDGKHKWYEVILVDRTHPRILADKKLNWLSLKQGRAYRGLTSAGRKARGLR